jgi:hypothetical protein
MFGRCMIIMLILTTACQTGRIPCPKVKTAKLKKTTVSRYAGPSLTPAFAAKVSEQEESTVTEETPAKKIPVRGAVPSETKFVKNVSVEEWDCPRPGEKKYMPRSVKQNIRQNMKRMNQSAADSLQQKRNR